MGFKKSWIISYELAKIDFKAKNKKNFLGTIWYVLDPLIFFIIFLLIRSLVGSDIPNYPAYLLVGLMVFNFFRKSTTFAATSLINNENLLKSQKINKSILIKSSIINIVFTHIFEIMILVCLLFYLKSLTIGFLFYPVLIIPLLMFIYGISFSLATLSVYIRDIPNMWGALMRILWLATPIFYSSRIELPLNFNLYNPLNIFITLTRDVIVYNTIPNTWTMMSAILFGFCSLTLGLIIFKILEIGVVENL